MDNRMGNYDGHYVFETGFCLVTLNLVTDDIIF